MFQGVLIMQLPPDGIGVEISRLFYKLRDTLPDTITLKTHKVREIKPINENSTLGEQIRYYRQLANIEQRTLAKKLKCDRGVIFNLENKEMKLVNIEFLKRVIKELKIEDKLIINDDYIAFLLNNPSKTIIDFRKKNNLKRVDLAKMVNIHASIIKKWEQGKAQLTRTSYNKLKKCMS